MPLNNTSMDLSNEVVKQLCHGLKTIPFQSTTATRIIPMYMAVINVPSSFLAILLNTAVINCILRTDHLQTPRNTFILLLSFIDLSIGAITQPLFTIQSALQSIGIYSCGFEAVYAFLAYNTCAISYIFVCLLSAHQCFTVYFPFKSQQYITCRRCVIIALTLAAAKILLISLSFTKVVSEVTLRQLLISGFVFLSFVFVISYIFINIAVNKQKRKIIDQMRQCREEAARIQRERSKSRVILLIVTAFFICFVPTSVFLVVYAILGPRTNLAYIGVKITTVFVFANSAINPLIYVFRVGEIRVAVFKCLKKEDGTFYSFVPVNHIRQLIATE